MINSDVEIGWRRHLSYETLPWADDLTAALDVGDTVLTVTTVLTDLLTGAPFPAGLLGSPTITGNVVQQTVTGLAPGHNYRLVFNAGLGGSKVRSSVVKLSTPY